MVKLRNRQPPGSQQPATTQSSTMETRRTTRNKQVVTRSKRPVQHAVESDADDDEKDGASQQYFKSPESTASSHSKAGPTHSFNVQIEPRQDHTSKLPPELLQRVFEYCIRDHQPDRGERIKAAGGSEHFVEQPHVLFVLAAVSHYFNANVEDVCRRELKKNPTVYATYASEAVRTKAAPGPAPRRTARNQKKSAPAPRSYRNIIAGWIASHCVLCNSPAATHAPMANGLCVCGDHKLPSAEYMVLKKACAVYDLQDAMLLKSKRAPGSKADRLNLPSIFYASIFHASVWARSGRFYESRVHYFFRKEDVEMIAALVHGDVDKHMKDKNAKWQAHHTFLETRRQLKLRCHTVNLIEAERPEEQESYKNRIRFYDSPYYDGRGYSVLMQESPRCIICTDDPEYGHFGHLRVWRLGR